MRRQRYDFCRFVSQPNQRRTRGARVVGDELHGIDSVLQCGEVGLGLQPQRDGTGHHRRCHRGAGFCQIVVSFPVIRERIGQILADSIEIGIEAVVGSVDVQPWRDYIGFDAVVSKA